MINCDNFDQYRGSQIQNRTQQSLYSETVQGNLEFALNKFFKKSENHINVTFSSRTDSGVHAIKTGVHFDLPAFNGNFLLPETIQKKLNHYFVFKSENIRILDVVPVSNLFHARYSALEKVYVYRIGLLKQSYTNDKFSYQLPISEIERTYFLRDSSFDLEKVKNAIKLFKGEKDFGAFTANYSKNTRSTICRINYFNLESCHALMPNLDLPSQKYYFYQFVCSGSRFLYKMVRRMVGALLAIGSDKLSLIDIQLMFTYPFPPPHNKIITAPGYALYLSDVTFNPKHIMLTEEEKYNKIKLLEVTKNNCELNSNFNEGHCYQVPFKGFRSFLEKISSS